MQKSLCSKLPQLRVLVLAVQAAWGWSAWALPQGATVVNGQVVVSQPSAGAMQIKASNGAIINWKQFSIGGGESTQFLQPSASSAVLNRVTGADPSQLLGQLKANGQVFLINPNGLVVGSGARIDTSSFIGSTLDITDADFLAGRLRFLSGAGAGRIRNEGLITVVPGGRIALIAPDIENTGIIQAPDGNILLAAGRKLEIASMDLEGVTFEIQAPTDSVLNLGKLLAENGAVRAFAGTLRHSGEIRASRLVQDSDGSIVLAGSNNVTLTADSVTSANGVAGGSVLVQSSHGTARVSGEVSAAGAAGSGGDIRLLGQRVALESGARINASGGAGGGQILVGGDFQGKNAGVQNAERVYVAAGAQLNADATTQGDGGRVIVWADENTRYYGSLSARGGADGGNGGLAEVSGKTNLEFAGAANLSAPAGLSGSLLLDPLDIIISATSGILPSVVDEFSDFSSNVVTVSPEALAKVAANITLQAERDIYIKDAVALTTSGAGFTATAGGALFDAGTIYNNAGISTTAGAVTLRAEGISGAGGITTTGGVVDLLTSGSLNYAGAISSGGGLVTLASQSGSVNNADVNAGSGVINVTGQTGVFGGSYTTAGTANLTATSGSISGSDVSAGVANLTATSSINADVDVTDRVNASSSGSYAQIYNNDNGTGPLRLGTLTGNSGLYLHSSTGMEQASGGLLTSTFVNLYTDGGSTAAGTLAAPLLIASPSASAQPSVSVFDMAAPVHLGFSGSPTLGGLTLEGTVAALGASTVNAGSSANLTSLSLGAGTGVLNISAVSTGGLADGFQLNVSDGAINAATLTLPGAPVDLTANGAVTVGTMSGDSLSISAKGAVAITSATTTGSSGIYVNTGTCDYYAYVACAASSPITAGTLNAGTAGDVNLSTDDNGDINVTGSLTARSTNLQVGTTYYTAYPNYPYYSQSTNNNINIASATTANSFTARNYGIGDIGIGALSSSGSAYLSAGTTYRLSALSYPYYTDVRTVNNISVANAEPASATGSFQVNNSGIGNVTVTGAINRPSGSITLSAQNGSVMAASNHSAANSINVSAGGNSVLLGNLSSSGGGISVNAGTSATLGNLTANTQQVSVNAGTTLTVGQVSSGSSSSYGNVTLSAGGNLVFDSIASSGYYSSYGNVNLTSSSGSIKTTANNTALDVTASSNVTLTANDLTNGFIGEISFANPMDIQAGANSAVTLSAGKDIGATGKPVNVDTSGTLAVTSANGQFHVAATAATGETSLSTIRLSAAAAGIGSGNTSTFTSADLDVTAASDGSVITIGDLVRSAGTLNEFKFAATGSSGLSFGNVDLTTIGFNQVLLSGTNGLTQAAGSNINAGSVSLDGGSGPVTVGTITSALLAGNKVNISGGGDITTGTISGTSVSVTGAALNLGSVISTGTQRYIYASPDSLTLTGSGNIQVAGDLTSATVIKVQSTGGDVAIGGAVTGTGTWRYPYSYVTDTVDLSASGNLTTGGAVKSQTTVSVIGGGNVQIGGAGVSGGTVCCSYVTDTVTVTAGSASSLTVDAIVGGYNKVVSGGALNILGGITGATNNTTVSGTTFNTGHLKTGGTLTINASGGYAPVSLLDGSTTLSGNTVQVNATGNIDVNSTTNSVVLTAPNVGLKSSGGNISAELAGTSNLTIDTAAGFKVSSDTWMNYLNITAQWDKATAAGSVGASVASSTTSGSQSFSYSNGSSLNMNASSILDAGRSWNLTYRDRSAVATPDVQFSANHLGSGTFDLAFDSATVWNASATLGATNLRLSSAGSVNMGRVSTQGGSVYATSSGNAVTLSSVSTAGGQVVASALNDVTVDSVNTSGTSGGAVVLTSSGGNIVSASVNQLINTAGGLSAPTAGGSVSMYAGQGSVGTAATPMNVDYTRALTLQAKNEIQVVANNSNLNSLSLDTYASGSGAVSITGSNNFSGMTLTRVDTNTNLALGALDPSVSTPGAFSLTARDGSIKVTGDVANLTNLTLDSKLGNVEIQANGAAAARSVTASGQISLSAGQDILIAAGSAASESVSVSGGTLQLSAGRDLKVVADGASAQLTSSAAAYFQSLTAGQDFLVTGGAGANASAAVVLSGSSSYQTFAAGRDLTVAGGNGTGSFALLQSANTYQQTLNVGRDLLIHGGGGTGAFAKINQSYPSVGNQSGTVYGNFSVLGGDASSGQGTGSYAELSGGYQNFTSVRGNLRVAGGTAADNSALLAAGSSQSLGTTSSSGGSATDSVSVLGGAGDRAFARISAVGSQSIYAAKDRTNSTATGDIKVLGGSGLNATAELTAGSNQNLGSQSDYCYYYGCYDPTQNILVKGGSGDGSFASVRAVSSQSIYGGGDISVMGSSGTGSYAEIVSSGGGQNVGSAGTSNSDATGNILIQGGAGSAALASLKATGFQSINAGGTVSVLGNTGAGANAEIVSSGSGQQIGSTTDTYYNDATASILVQAGSGGVARIQALGSQTLMTGGDLSVLGGGAANMTASIESTGGSQNMGSTYMFSNDPTGNVLVQAGGFSGAAAWIKASTGQTLDAGGTITLTGGAAGAFAEISTSTGSQNIGNVNCCSYDQTDSISLTGGTAAGSYAKVATGGSQTVRTSVNLSLTGGVGSDSGAQLIAGTGQSVTAFGNLSMVGGNGTGIGLQATAIRNSTSGNQSLDVSGDITVAGGSGLADTWIYQVGSGLQRIEAGGNLKLSSDASNVNVTSIEAIGIGGQTIDVGGAITVDNKSGWHVNITSAGTQTVTADSLAVSLSSTSGASPFAGLTATGNQAITLNGVDADLDHVNDAGTATLSVVNLSSAAGSVAAVSSSANQTILMDYDAAGQVVIGDVAGQGVAKVTAGADHTLVAGSLLIQGGSGVGSDASLQAPGTMVLSTLYGPVELKGGLNGAAFIDPLLLNVASNGSVLLLAGTNATADASITAGTFNLAATIGNLSLINSSLATASIATTTFNFTGPGSVNLVGGTITATSGGAINVVGLCNNCSTNLIGPFSVTAFVPPPTNFGAAVAGDILILSDLASGLFDAYIDEAGNLVLTRRRLNQCY